MTRPKPATAIAAATQLPVRLVVALQARSTTLDRERGDVPGWVLVTLMSALIVVGLIATLQAQLGAAFSRALNSVSTP